ncbi:rubredoxin [bacterium]|nr:MAG: rubredoxin [bacterium]
MCRWLYKEDKEGQRFEDLPDDWKCPVCNANKSQFEKIS